MPYNRTQALAYARRYWDRTCTDGYIAGSFRSSHRRTPQDTGYALKVGADIRFGYDSTVGETLTYSYPHRRRDGTVEYRTAVLPPGPVADCAHFISCCIGSPPGGTGGGLPLPQPTAPAYGILGAETLLRHLLASGAGTRHGRERMDREAARRHIGGLAPGDLIFYARTRTHGHSAIYLGTSGSSPVGNVACHSYSRSDSPDFRRGDENNDWDLLGNWSYTFVKMVGR